MKLKKLTEIILEGLEELEEGTTGDLLELFFSGYFHSYRKARQMLSAPTLPNFKRHKIFKKTDFSYKEKQNFYSLLSYLQKQGIIKKNDKRGRFWKITTKGKEKLKTLKEKINIFPLRKYKIENENKFKIIIFDIPEKEKLKRNWLRNQLLIIGFKMLQKSVWISRNKLPKEFFEDLKELNLLQYIHIFPVDDDKKGTLRNF